MFCPNCGSENKNNVKYCKVCGYAIAAFLEGNNISTIEKKEKTQETIVKKKTYDKKKMLLSASILMVVVIVICTVYAIKNGKEDIPQVELQEPSAPLTVEYIEEQFYDNEVNKTYTYIQNYDETGNILLEVKQDENGNQLERIEYLYEESMLVGAHIYDQNGLSVEVNYELNSEGYITKETFFVPNTDVGTINVPINTIYYEYDDKHTLISKQGNDEKWEYDSEEGVEKYYKEINDTFRLSCIKEYDVLENLTRYVEYDEAGNIVASEKYTNEITYDEYNRPINCESYVEDVLVYTKTTKYFPNEDNNLVENLPTEIEAKETDDIVEITENEIASVDGKEVIVLGKYEQDNNLENGPENIEWIVLADDEYLGIRMVISKYLLDAKYYNQYAGVVSWKDCSVNEWLNTEFYNTAFDMEDKNRILNVTMNDSEGFVQLLSVEEAQQYFTSDAERTAELTEYAKANGAATYTYSNGNNGAWWTRTYGDAGNYTAIICADGSIDTCGGKVPDSGFCVRPVLYLRMD